MPSLNVGSYIKQCIDSVTAQTLKDIEIICVDAGSSDGTLEILNEAAASDPRIRIVHSDIKSYGYQMNLGLGEASGEYIGIIETDDWAEPSMFENLYELASANAADAAKGSFWFYYSDPEKNTPFKLSGKFATGMPFCPTELASAGEMAEFFNIKPTIWSAIYRRSFLEENDIRFNETPGASYQDAGFNFKVWACAQKACLIQTPFLHYRQDNEQSSVNSPSKVYCVCDEYREIERFVTEHFSDGKRQMLLNLMERLKYDSYVWNYERLVSPLEKEFAENAGAEFASDFEKGYASEEYFPQFKWESLNLWKNDPAAFMAEMDKRKNRSFAARAFDRIRRSLGGK